MIRLEWRDGERDRVVYIENLVLINASVTKPRLTNRTMKWCMMNDASNPNTIHYFTKSSSIATLYTYSDCRQVRRRQIEALPATKKANNRHVITLNKIRRVVASVFSQTSLH